MKATRIVKLKGPPQVKELQIPKPKGTQVQIKVQLADVCRRNVHVWDGLGASIWTEDLDKAENLSKMVRSGMVAVNNVVISDPRVPFGGVKNSGFGRVITV